MKNKSVMQHAFSMIPSVAKPRSVFDRSHGYKTTFDADYLIPFYAKNVLPGDSVNLKHSVLLRLASPAVRPFMDNLFLDTFYFSFRIDLFGRISRSFKVNSFHRLIRFLLPFLNVPARMWRRAVLCDRFAS